jgi:hypothetical protein
MKITFDAVAVSTTRSKSEKGAIEYQSEIEWRPDPTNKYAKRRLFVDHFVQLGAPCTVTVEWPGTDVPEEGTLISEAEADEIRADAREEESRSDG